MNMNMYMYRSPSERKDSPSELPSRSRVFSSVQKLSVYGMDSFFNLLCERINDCNLTSRPMSAGSERRLLSFRDRTRRLGMVNI